MEQTHALGIDIGGTFTDIVVYDRATGRIEKGKELTTPDDPSRGVLTGLTKLLEGGVATGARACAAARVGRSDQQFWCGALGEMAQAKIEEVPHSIVILGELHFVEEEALAALQE